jgi:outer membrane protein OmpA-like peptidoglycan-associated protein
MEMPVIRVQRLFASTAIGLLAIAPSAGAASLSLSQPPRHERILRVQDSVEEAQARLRQALADLQAAQEAGGDTGAAQAAVEDAQRELEAAQQGAAAQAQRAAEEEAARQAEAEAEAQRAAEEEAARKAAEDEAARQAEAEAQRAAEEEAARKAAEDEAARQAEAEAQRAAEEEAARKAAEDEAARQAEVEAQRASEEEAARKAAEDEAARQAEAEAQRAAEEEAARKASEEQQQAPAEPTQPVEPAPEPEAPAPEPEAPAPAPEKPAEPAPEQPAEPQQEAAPPAPEQPADQLGAAPPAPQEPPLPEDLAPILDSQKAGDGPPEPAAPPADPQVAAPPAPPPPPPPVDDRSAQRETVVIEEILPVTEEKPVGERRRPVRSEEIPLPADFLPDTAKVVEKVTGGIIIQIGTQVIVERSDRERLSRRADDIYVEELSRGRTRETIVKPDGVQIITVRNRWGEIIRRSRIEPDGSEYVLVYAPYLEEDRERPREWIDPGRDLPPMRLTIPVREYILDAGEAEDEEFVEFLAKPPVENVERLYSIDEVRRSARIRDKVRRVDLDTLTFDSGSATVSATGIRNLGDVAGAMRELIEKNPAETFLIEGHTDAVGSDIANLSLSDRRAEAVAVVLTEVYRIPAENLVTQGYGERYLKIDTQAAERLNRRVAIRRISTLVAPEVASR